MGRLRVRIKDKRICGLVKAFLKSGIFTEFGDREESLSGTPQGGILSPLLSGIPEVLLVTRRQPWAGPGRGGIQHLTG